MSDTPDFTDREKKLLYDTVKPRRFDSDEHYDLYEKVSTWALGGDADA